MSIVVVDFFGPDLKRVNNTRVLWKIVIKFVYKKHPISGNEWFIAVHNWEIDLCIKPIMLGNWYYILKSVFVRKIVEILCIELSREKKKLKIGWLQGLFMQFLATIWRDLLGVGITWVWESYLLSHKKMCAPNLDVFFLFFCLVIPLFILFYFHE